MNNVSKRCDPCWQFVAALALAAVPCRHAHSRDPASWPPEVVEQQALPLERQEGRRFLRYEHGVKPEWGYPEAQRDYFYLVEPRKPGPGAPLYVVLHSAGEQGLTALRNGFTQNKEGRYQRMIFHAPEDHYGLYLDCTSNKKMDFWWGWQGISKDQERFVSQLHPAEKRVLDTIAWVIETFQIDRNRVYLCGLSMGGSGSLGLALTHGDLFAAVQVRVPAGVKHGLWRLGVKPESLVREVDSPEWLRTISAAAFPDPPVLLNLSAQDDAWSKDQGLLIKLAQKGLLPLVMGWGAFGHNIEAADLSKFTPIAAGFPWLAIRRNEAYPVFTRASSDQVSPWVRKEGADAAGQMNAVFRWKTLQDTPEKLVMELRLAGSHEFAVPVELPEKATADVTLRRMQRFKVQPGQSVFWKAIEKEKGLETASGEIQPDAAGLLTLPQLAITAKPVQVTLSVASAAAPAANHIAEVEAILDRNLAIRTALASGPGLRNDANIIGNGEVKASLYGMPDLYKLLLERDDCFFDQGKAGRYFRIGTLAAGELEIRMPSLKGKACRQEQDMRRAEVRLIVEEGDALATITSKALRTGGGLVLNEIHNRGQSALAVELASFARPSDAPETQTIHRHAGVSKNEILWSSRRNQPGAKKYSMWIAMATRVLDVSPAFHMTNGYTAVAGFVVPPGGKVRILTGVASTGIPLTLEPADPMPKAIERVRGIAAAGLERLEREHQESWDEFWAKAFIAIPAHPLIERFYYGALYALGSTHRPDGSGYAPGIAGWNCYDAFGTRWGNAYTFNYNIQSIYWGIYAANRPELDASYFRVLKEMTDRNGTQMAANHGLPGINLPSGGAIQGVINWNFKVQRTNGIEAAIPLIHHWLYTYDTEWLKTVFPWLLGIADYWDDSLDRDRGEDGVYRVHKASVRESGEEYATDNIAALAYLHCFYRGMVDISRETGLAATRREKWERYLGALAPYPSLKLPDGKQIPALATGITFEKDFNHGKWGMHGMPLTPVFPGNHIGRDSDEAQMFRNALACGRFGDYTEESRRAHWEQENNFVFIYTAAVRLGWDFADIIGRMNSIFSTGDKWRNTLGGNNFYKQMGGYIETCGGIEAIQSMLLQSQEGVIRLFPNWDRSDANFRQLRAMGAFLVSAEMKDGMIGGVRISSERGRPCHLMNPWPGKRVEIRGADGRILPVQESGGVLEFVTRKGGRYCVSPENN